MKRLALIAAVIALLALTQMSQAADLKAGWYANIYSVYVYVPADPAPYPVVAAEFQIAPNTYGPFIITDGVNHAYYERDIFVPADAHAGVGQSLVLPVYIPDGTSISFLSMSIRTNYDAEQMRLQLWHTRSTGEDQLVWEQGLSGNQLGLYQTAYNTFPEEGFYFKMAVVPEPSSSLPLLLGVPAVFVWWRRSRR